MDVRILFGSAFLADTWKDGLRHFLDRILADESAQMLFRGVIVKFSKEKRGLEVVIIDKSENDKPPIPTTSGRTYHAGFFGKGEVDSSDITQFHNELTKFIRDEVETLEVSFSDHSEIRYLAFWKSPVGMLGVAWIEKSV